MADTTYDSIADTLLEQENFNFVYDNETRLKAAEQLSAGGLDALLVIANYYLIRGHFEIDEPCPEVETTLNQIWDDNIRKYQGLEPEQFLDEVSSHFLGRVPERSEVLPADEYQKIVHAFHAFIVPGMVMGKVDGFLARGAPEYTLQRILTGYERITAASKPQPQKE